MDGARSILVDNEWHATAPIPIRVLPMFRFRRLLDAHLDGLTELVATENGTRARA